MAASRNTILALGLMSIVLAACKSAAGAPSTGCDSSCEASCGSCGGAPTCDATCNGNGGCSADGNGATSTCTTCLDDDPVFASCRQHFNDLCETCRGCTWKAEASALILHRSTPGTQAVLFEPTSGANLFDASRLEFPYAAGPRVSLTALDCEGWGFELNYFGIDGWSATKDIPNGSLPSGTANLTVDSVTQLSLTDAHFESTARLYSAEVNFRKPLFANLSLLAGFRWLEMTDKYLAGGTSATTGNTSSETILTHNHLYGFQIGADGPLAQEANRWRINGFVKGGIFLNSADQATSLSDPGGLGSLAVNNNNNNDTAAFFGEAGIVGYFQITKHFSASGGYQVMFINGVAQPVNQLSGTNLANSTATVDVTSGLFYHGASAGLELTW
ncbi:MAG: hypothetical protein ACLP9L_00110 [Thermoguttaceae bacterium]